jgi:hypothetical protein
LADDGLPSLPLTDQGNGWYGVTYGGFTERGAYRVVVHAEDWEGLEAQPTALVVSTGPQVYLPMVFR